MSGIEHTTWTSVCSNVRASLPLEGCTYATPTREGRTTTVQVGGGKCLDASGYDISMGDSNKEGAIVFSFMPKPEQCERSYCD